MTTPDATEIYQRIISVHSGPTLDGLRARVLYQGVDVTAITYEAHAGEMGTAHVRLVTSTGAFAGLNCSLGGQVAIDLADAGCDYESAEARLAAWQGVREALGRHRGITPTTVLDSRNVQYAPLPTPETLLDAYAVAGLIVPSPAAQFQFDAERSARAAGTVLNNAQLRADAGLAD